MGNCVEAWGKVKAKRIEKTTAEMLEGFEAQLETYQAKQVECEGKIRQREQEYEKFVKVIKNRKANPMPTRAERATLVRIKNHISVYQKQIAQWSAKEIGMELTKGKLDQMKTNGSLLQHKRKIAKGYKKLKEAGLNVKDVEVTIDKESDAIDEIDDLNDACNASELDKFTQEELGEIEQAVNDDFGGTPQTTVIHAPKVPQRNLMDPAEEQEIEIDTEAIVLQTD
jgi:hypothetical protein